MKIKTTASKKTLERYDSIMQEHSVPTPYATDGDCFRSLMEDEMDCNPDFVLTVEWLAGEMKDQVWRDGEMLKEAAFYEEPCVPAWRKEHAKFRRQYMAFSARLESCRPRTIEI